MSENRELIEAKKQLRKKMRQKRDALCGADRLAAAQSVKLHFADHPHLTYASSFSAYMAIQSEIDLLPLCNNMIRFSKVISLPFIGKSNRIVFKRWQPGEPLTDGSFHTKQPAEEAEEIIPDVILVPLLAFDAQGYRLGYGGGYYDEALNRLRNECDSPPLAFGVAYAMQEVPHIPREAHDMPLDGILTEQGVSMFARDLPEKNA